mmetsp:Transcript_31504/g.74126  ORF Transcript_31504/g.74126 Transcript_31504/m.74126 type:complete len:228 (+) Transcript_31504:86-769(+)
MSKRSSKSKKTAEDAGIPNETAEYMRSLQNPDVIERVRCVIKDAHVFKLPPRAQSGGWRGADWRDEVWQGTVKVVERGEMTLVLLVDRTSGDIFAVCPIKDGAVDRCVDSSRYFVLRIENENGRHMFVGMAFNERNDAFDFNTSLEDARREQEAAKEPQKKLPGLPSKDYSIKEGEKIRVNLKSMRGDSTRSTKSKGDGFLKPSSKDTKSKSGGFLKPSAKDTPRRS